MLHVFLKQIIILYNLEYEVSAFIVAIFGNAGCSAKSIKLPADENKISLPSIKEMKLIDKMGNVKFTKRYADVLTKTDRINIAGLPNDIYTLLIFNGTDWESHKIVKQ